MVISWIHRFYCFMAITWHQTGSCMATNFHGKNFLGKNFSWVNEIVKFHGLNS